MPNDCYNEIKVIGDPRELKKFDEQFRKTHDVYSGYDTIIKIGEEKEISLFNEPIKDLKIKIDKYQSFINDNSSDTFKLTVAGNKETVNDYSFNNFIDLGDVPSLDDSRREWGTKWDLYYLNKEYLEEQLKDIDKIIEKEDEINANRD